MHLGAAAEDAHLLAQLRFYQRVDDDRRTALGALDGELEVLHCLHPRMPDLLERLLGELRSSAITSRVAVSPVASETMCSSTGAFTSGNRAQPA